MPVNPNWTRDELILALDLYFRCNPTTTTPDDPAIVELSRTLNELPIHVDRPDAERFRNPNGVHMKLSNFLRFDESYAGRGLTRGGHLEAEIWDEFAQDRERLGSVAQAIQQSRSQISTEQVAAELGAVEGEFPEGRVLTAIHRSRERSAAAVQRKKDSVMQSAGKLQCEACGFDFEAVYGPLGHGYAECHHTVPLASLAERTPTRAADLAIVCANCHRMIHRAKPMMTVQELGRLVTSEIVDF